MAVKHVVYHDKEFNINYEIINKKERKIIVFLHGWGSNKEIMKQAFSSQMQGFKHLYIDMPGFGKSQNNYILTTKDYANIIKIFLKAILSDKEINAITIAGHSFGGKVATLLKPKLLILLSTAGILETKSTKTLLTIRMAKIFNRFGLGKVTKLLRSKDVCSMDQNMYETFKNIVDEDFSQTFASYTNDTLIFWGELDTATTLSSGKLINILIANSTFYSYKSDHYFFLKYSNDISKIVSKSLNF